MSPEANPRDMGVPEKGGGHRVQAELGARAGPAPQAHTSALRPTSSSSSNMTSGLTSPCLSFFICKMGLIKA